MARQAVTRSKQQFMSQEKKMRPKVKSGERPERSPTSQMSLSDPETRTKATIKDIEELYAALQGLVPKPNQRPRSRGTRSGTDSDTPKDVKHKDTPPFQRRYHSEMNLRKKKLVTDGNMNYAKSIENLNPNEEEVHTEILSDDRLFASDTELELSSTNITQTKPRLQRHKSLPVYDEESADDMINEDVETPKRSKFSLFRRRRRTKTKNKKKKSWRAIFSTLSLRRRSSKKPKRSKNKMFQGVVPKDRRNRVVQHSGTKKQLSSPLDDRNRKATPTLSYDDSISGPRTTNDNTPKMKRAAPDPPESLSDQHNQRRNTLETKSNEVQRKLSVWYKHAVKETHSDTPVCTRYTKSCENLLTDTEILRSRETRSSDTDSVAGSDRYRANVNRVRVRKTRARRNRTKERARWRSLPNVKLVWHALEETNNKSDKAKTAMDDSDNEKKSTLVSGPETPVSGQYSTTVKPLEAKLSFGTTLDENKTNVEPISDFMNIQRENGSRWVSRQCSKTTISCIRPLKLNLFYSESPSRETIHRSRSSSTCGPCLTELSEAINAGTTDGIPHEIVLKVRRSSGRRRKRKSFRRQARLPHQSPFYFPDDTSGSLNLSPQSDKQELLEDAEESGIGSPDLSEEKVFGLTSLGKRGHQPFKKLNWESEDSGWASRDNLHVDRADTAIQTDPVIVMTAVSVARRPRQPHVIGDKSDENQSEA